MFTYGQTCWLAMACLDQLEGSSARCHSVRPMGARRGQAVASCPQHSEHSFEPVARPRWATPVRPVLSCGNLVSDKTGKMGDIGASGTRELCLTKLESTATRPVKQLLQEHCEQRREVGEKRRRHYSRTRSRVPKVMGTPRKGNLQQNLPAKGELREKMKR